MKKLFKIFFKNTQNALIFRAKRMRIDKFLKVSRLLKRRTVAGDAARGGRVKINGKTVKPAHEVKVGDVVELGFQSGTVILKVLAVKETVRKEETSSLYEIISE